MISGICPLTLAEAFEALQPRAFGPRIPVRVKCSATWAGTQYPCGFAAGRAQLIPRCSLSSPPLGSLCLGRGGLGLPLSCPPSNIVLMEIDFFRVLPAGLVDRLQTESPPFANLPERHQANVAQMLWDYASARHRHKRLAGAAFSTTYMRRLWGNLRARNRVVPEFFCVIQGDNIGHHFSSYEPYDAIGNILVQFLRDERPVELLHNGRRLSLPRRPVLSRAANDDPAVIHPKNSVWQRAMPAGLLPVNEAALLKFAKTAANQHHRLSALRLLRLSRNTMCPGSIPLLYEQKSTGRLAEVLFSIQNTEREVLSAALDGFWDYDLRNAHFGIFSQWAKRLGHQTPAVDEYQRDKQRIRKRLASCCLAAEEDVKESLIALLYGASLNSNPDFASIPRVLGEEAAAIFIADSFVKELTAEIKKVGAALVADTKLANGAYVNALGIRASKHAGRSAFTLLCHALQGVEAQALQAVVKNYGDRILLCMHDGWVSRERLDREEVEALIKATTGLRLTVEEQQLPKYPPKKGRRKPWSFGGSPITRNEGLWVSNSPQWSLPPFVHGRRTRSDTVLKSSLNNAD